MYFIFLLIDLHLSSVTPNFNNVKLIFLVTIFIGLNALFPIIVDYFIIEFIRPNRLEKLILCNTYKYVSTNMYYIMFFK